MADANRRPARSRLPRALGAAPLLLALAAGPAAGAPDRAGPVGGPAAATRAADPYGTPVPLNGLVPGRPLPPGAADTPDEALPPDRRPAAGTPAPAPAAGDGAAARTEFVPARDAADLRESARHPAARTARDVCSRYTGPYQGPVDTYLGLPHGPGTPDRQTPAHCSAVRRYQRAHRIEPATGFAGPVTWGAMLDERLAAGPAPAPGPHCPPAPGRTACVDQDRGLLWVRDGGRVLLGPLRVRTGLPGAPTRDGVHRVGPRDAGHVSAVYGTPMPWAQYFDGGRAFHGVLGSLFAPTGTSGGVGLRPADARRLWRTLRPGDRVVVWGRRHG